ncbi:MAG: class I SAM-dependent methyltransferase [Chloroflexota bacterium]
MSMYDQIARYYDLIHARLTVDLPLVLALAQQADGPILELGCGTGRLLRPLARAGYQVTGVDNSEAMLARCRQALAEETAATKARITLVKADLPALDKALGTGNEQFALVIIAYNTLMHLSLNQVNDLLRQLRPYLMKNGRLFIDVANPFFLAETADAPQLTLENQFADPQTGDHILQFATTRLDSAAQICHVTWIFDASPAAGGGVQRHLSQMAYHYFYPHELEMALQSAAYRLEQLWGNYDQTPFAEDSERLLLLAGKR